MRAVEQCKSSTDFLFIEVLKYSICQISLQCLSISEIMFSFFSLCILSLCMSQLYCFLISSLFISLTEVKIFNSYNFFAVLLFLSLIAFHQFGGKVNKILENHLEKCWRNTWVNFISTTKLATISQNLYWTKCF